MFLKTKLQVMYIVNIGKKDTQKQTEPIFDIYRNNLEDVMDSNIDNTVHTKNNFLFPSKPNVSAFLTKKATLLLFRLFSNNTRVTSSKNNNLSIFLLANSSLKLPSSIMLNDSSNLLLKSNNYRL